MIEDVEKGLVQKIIVYRLDRFSRSIADFGRLWEILKRHNVEFVSINETFDTSTPMAGPCSTSSWSLLSWSGRLPPSGCGTTTTSGPNWLLAGRPRALRVLHRKTAGTGGKAGPGAFTQ